MTVLFRHFRSFATEAPRKPTTTTTTRKQSRQHLQVKISKEPPTILYFEASQDEQHREYIFDPMVHHDEEKDHPDLFEAKQAKPWMKPPHCRNDATLMKRLTSLMRIKSPVV